MTPAGVWPRRWSPSGVDARALLRAIRRGRSGAAATVLMLGVGIGGSTTIAAAFQGILLNPLPFPEAERIAQIGGERTIDGSLALLPSRFWTSRRPGPARWST